MKRLTAVLLAAIYMFATTSAVAAGTGRCDPGRPSDTTQKPHVNITTLHINDIDAVRGDFRDMDPYVESGWSYAYILLKQNSYPGIAELGVKINSSGTRRVFIHVEDNNGNVVLDDYYSADGNGASHEQQGGGPADEGFNGDGDIHRLTVNPVNSGGILSGFQFLMDKHEIIGPVLFPFEMWYPDRAEVHYYVDNRGSQMWGRDGSRAYTEKIEAEKLGSDSVIYTDFTKVDQWAVAGTLLDFSTNVTFKVWDTDCP